MGALTAGVSAEGAAVVSTFSSDLSLALIEGLRYITFLHSHASDGLRQSVLVFV